MDGLIHMAERGDVGIRVEVSLDRDARPCREVITEAHADSNQTRRRHVLQLSIQVIANQRVTQKEKYRQLDSNSVQYQSLRA